MTVLAALPDGVLLPHSALVIIDAQPDFMPGGPLACEQGDAIVDPIAALVARGGFTLVVATQDWHPPHHVSFACEHPGCQPFETIEIAGHPQMLWPVHCVQESAGAALHPGLDASAIDLLVRKGQHRDTDAYSAFQDFSSVQGVMNTTGLVGCLHERGITDVYLCGLAREVCVLASAKDAVNAGFNTHFLWSLTRPVSSTTDQATYEHLQRLGVEIIGGPDIDS